MIVPVMLASDRTNWRSLIAHARCAADMPTLKLSAKAFEIIAKACWSAVTPSQIPAERLLFSRLIAFGKSWPAMDVETRELNAAVVRELANRCGRLLGDEPTSPAPPPAASAARLPYADDTDEEDAA